MHVKPSEVDKAQLRKHFRQQRRLIDAQTQIRYSEQISQQLCELVDSSESYAGYLASDGEVNLMPFIQRVWQDDGQLVLPVLHPFCSGFLLFQQFTRATEMTKNRYAIDEPTLNCPAVVPLSQIDIILMPLVAFDKHKNRLGMGGGFYDRTLANTNKLNKRPRLIGIAHSNQCYQGKLPVEQWDISLDNIVTPDYIL